MSTRLLGALHSTTPERVSYIFWQKGLISVFFKIHNAALSAFSFQQNDVYFIILSFSVHTIFMFYVKNVIKFICPPLSFTG